MKTVKFTSAIAIFSLVFFVSFASIAKSSNSSDLTKSGDKSMSVANTTEKDFSYLRFDVNKYMNEDEEANVIYSSLDYLRFNVNDFINESENEEIEFSAANDFEYLRFDVNNFATASDDSNYELPLTE